MRSLRYLSGCSGIESASVAWAPLRWEAVGFSEIEKFPCELLAQRFPNVPNFGDMTKFKDWPNATIDILVGGTPCQSFSVAGLRKGLADPRGNLTLTFLAIVDKYRPPFVVWENVPGIISDKTDALRSFMDGLEALNYIVDIDILDAQFFGLAQRRRRIFICAQSREDLLSRKTDSSALTIAQCLTEILHAICLVGSRKFAKGRPESASAGLSVDGAKRRMRLFGLLTESEDLWPKLREHLTEALARSLRAQEKLESASGGDQAGDTLEGPSTVFLLENQFTLTEASLSAALDAALEVMKSFITSTATRETTQAEIFICSKAALRIAGLIVRLNPSLPPFWSAALSSLTAIRDCIAYARSASSDLFTELEWLQPWSDFVGQAERTAHALGNLRIQSFGRVSPISESSDRDSAPRREAGKRIASPLAGCSNGGGANGPGRSADDAENLVYQPVAHCLNAGGMGRIDYESESFVVDKALGVASRTSSDGAACEIADSLTVGANQTTGFVGDVVAFDMRGREGGSQFEGPHETANIRAASGGSSRSYVAQQWAVRRLMPIECERLMGFPDCWTDIVRANGKRAADGPRYRALGNSFAVNVVRWIGRRINLVENFGGQSL